MSVLQPELRRERTGSDDWRLGPTSHMSALMEPQSTRGMNWNAVLDNTAARKKTSCMNRFIQFEKLTPNELVFVNEVQVRIISLNHVICHCESWLGDEFVKELASTL